MVVSALQKSGQIPLFWDNLLPLIFLIHLKYVTSFVRYNFHVCLVSWGALAPGGTPSKSIIEALGIELKLLLLLSIQDIPSTQVEYPRYPTSSPALFLPVLL